MNHEKAKRSVETAKLVAAMSRKRAQNAILATTQAGIQAESSRITARTIRDSKA